MKFKSEICNIQLVTITNLSKTSTANVTDIIFSLEREIDIVDIQSQLLDVDIRAEMWGVIILKGNVCNLKQLHKIIVHGEVEVKQSREKLMGLLKIVHMWRFETFSSYFVHICVSNCTHLMKAVEEWGRTVWILNAILTSKSDTSLPGDWRKTFCFIPEYLRCYDTNLWIVATVWNNIEDWQIRNYFHHSSRISYH